MVYAIQFYLYLALGLVALGIEVWALIDCVRRKPEYFDAAFKKTKGFWLGMTGGSVAVGVLGVIGSGLPFMLLLQLAAVIAASVYLADVKPAMEGLRGGHGRW
ncbi:DUF2516 family protein [Arthrobacter roseus]|uniref:DUF2516 family protein n=1 Tax=Arthrobacter roseus TaxID=136274 RepID=UPI001963D1B5|nr:DUF2516 family protein [Arthrobacter roseus]